MENEDNKIISDANRLLFYIIGNDNVLTGDCSDVKITDGMIMIKCSNESVRYMTKPNKLIDIKSFNL